MLQAKLIAPLRSLSRSLHKARSSLALMPQTMRRYSNVNSLDKLLEARRPSVWELYPEMRFPRHQGFCKDLCHETAASPIPHWWLDDRGDWAPPVCFARINNAILWPFDGVAITRSGGVIEESLFTLQERSPDLTAMPGTIRHRNRTILDLRTVVFAEEVDAPVLLAANGWNTAFGHWIYDTMTSIHTCGDIIRAGKLKLVFATLTGWQRAWLSLLQIPDRSVIEVGKRHVRARQALIASSLSIQNVRHPGPQAVDLMRFLRTCVDGQSSGSPYLYLSRAAIGTSSHRTLVGEDAIMAALGRLGFVTIAPETLSPSEQIRVFAHARVIIGPVGSAFALSGLAAPGACIIEILPPPATHNWIFRSSANFQHRYGCIMAEVIPESTVDLDSDGVQRNDWFYSYKTDLDVVTAIARRAIDLSAS